MEYVKADFAKQSAELARELVNPERLGIVALKPAVDLTYIRNLNSIPPERPIAA